PGDCCPDNCSRHPWWDELRRFTSFQRDHGWNAPRQRPAWRRTAGTRLAIQAALQGGRVAEPALEGAQQTGGDCAGGGVDRRAEGCRGFIGRSTRVLTVPLQRFARYVCDSG